MSPAPSRRPKKSLGQNFLIDGNLQRKIIEALDPSPVDEILEIGPGRGALTRHLAGGCRALHLVELDRELADDLQEEFGDIPGVRVMNRDILTVRPGEITDAPHQLKVVGNIPYNITTPILFHLLQSPRPMEILLMMQKEVGERVMATPGTSTYGALTVGVQTVATAERVLKVPATAFRPVPAVDSVVVRIRPLRPPPLASEEEKGLRFLTRIAFQRRRKQFQNILRNHPETDLDHAEVAALEEKTGFDLSLRPESLSPGDFIELARALREIRPGAGSSGENP
jgi:16S rRNA (adenine1518-N6/adenine1519-N6)-dimethyltransferase